MDNNKECNTGISTVAEAAPVDGSNLSPKKPLLKRLSSKISLRNLTLRSTNADDDDDGEDEAGQSDGRKRIVVRVIKKNGKSGDDNNTESPRRQLSQKLRMSRQLAKSLSGRRLVKSLSRRLSKRDVNQPLSPQEHLDSLLSSRGYSTSQRKTKRSGYYNKPTPLQLASYEAHVFDLIQEKKKEDFRATLASGISPNPSNKRGESLAHYVCGRGDHEFLSIMMEVGTGRLLQVANRDGETPLHAACRATVPSFKTIELIVRADRRLLAMKDRTGATPLSQVPQDSWPQWIEWLENKKDQFWPGRDKRAEGREGPPPLSTKSRNSHPLPDPSNALSASVASAVASGRIRLDELSSHPDDINFYVDQSMGDESLLSESDSAEITDHDHSTTLFSEHNEDELYLVAGNERVAVDDSVKESTRRQCPEEFLDALLDSRGYSTASYETISTGYYNKSTQLQMASYDNQLINCILKGRASSLREIMTNNAGDDNDAVDAVGIISQNPSNDRGESLLHLICRRGDYEKFRIMVDNGADIQIANDSGQTLLHEACWAAVPCFDLIEDLLNMDKNLLFMADQKGAVPLSYVPLDRWNAWILFLESKKDVFWPIIQYKENDDAAEQSPVPRPTSPALVGLAPNTRPLPDPKEAISLDLIEMYISRQVKLYHKKEGVSGDGRVVGEEEDETEMDITEDEETDSDAVSGSSDGYRGVGGGAVEESNSSSIYDFEYVNDLLPSWHSSFSALKAA